MNDKITLIKNHVHRYRGRYSFAAGITATLAVSGFVARANEWDAFVMEEVMPNIHDATV